MFEYHRAMAIFDDPLEPHVVEHLRRSITMLSPGQPATIDRDRVLVLIEELQRLRQTLRTAAADLRGLAGQLEAAPGRAAGTPPV